MALTVLTYKAQIQAIKNTFPVLAQILFAEEGGSLVGSFNLEADTIAQCMAIQGQLFDQYQIELTNIANSAVPTTDLWVQNEVFKFQYSASNPQYVQLINLIPTYPVIDSTLQIISRCSAVTLGNGVVRIKVATSEPPVALSSDQLTALISYCNNVIGGGVVVSLSSINADRLSLSAQVYYDGQFTASIQTDVKAAINAYLSSIPFDGVVVKSNIELAIKAVIGVNDVTISSMAGRASISGYTGVDSGRKYPTVAGYIIEEDTSGHTFSDSIIYTAE